MTIELSKLEQQARRVRRAREDAVATMIANIQAERLRQEIRKAGYEPCA